MNERKIFNVSLNRTGSSSFNTLMVEHGIKAIHNTKIFTQTFISSESVEKILNQPYSSIYRIQECIDYKKLDNFIEKYEAFSDLPFFALYEYLDKKYPNSLFIYIDRDPEEWFVSIKTKASRNYGLVINENKKPPFKNLSNIFKIIFGSSPPMDERKEHYLSIFKKHREDVLSYFKGKNNFFMVDLKDPEIGQKISKFCGFKNLLEFPKRNITINRQQSLYFKQKFFLPILKFKIQKELKKKNSGV